jgi:TolB-like protein
MGRGVLAALALAAFAPALFPLPSVGQEQDDRPGVAVWVFDNGGSYGRDAEDFEALRVGLQQMLLTELAQSSSLRIVERRQLRDLMSEQDLGTTDRVDAGTAARVGHLVGARYMVLGGFTDWFGDMRLDARIVDVETSEILEGVRVRDDRQNMYDMVVDLAVKVIDAADLPPLPEDVVEERASREIPEEAWTLYSHALVQQDFGLHDEARELLRRITQEFPELTEAEEALRQYERGEVGED